MRTRTQRESQPYFTRLCDPIGILLGTYRQTQSRGQHLNSFIRIFTFPNTYLRYLLLYHLEGLFSTTLVMMNIYLESTNVKKKIVCNRLAASHDAWSGKDLINTKFIRLIRVTTCSRACHLRAAPGRVGLNITRK